MAGPITGLRILDLTAGIVGPYATKLLADYGADVVKVEPPRGDVARQFGPFPEGLAHAEKSGAFFYFNTNKRSAVLDLKHTDGREALLHLVDGADIVVESFRPGTLQRLGLGWEVLHARKPATPLVSITNFGQDSPYRHYEGSELVLYGFGGEMYTMGVAEREPVKMFGTAGMVESGAAASTAIFAAVMAAVGQHVDFSIVDSQFGGADRRHAAMVAYEFSGRHTTRVSVDARGILRGVYPCADGYVELSAAGTRLDRLAAMLDDPEWLHDPKWRLPGALVKSENAEEFDANFYPWLYSHTKRQIWAAAREARVLCGPLFTLDEIAADDHFRDRGFWTTVRHAALGEVEMPGRPFIMHDSPWEIRRPAPLLGEHTREILAEAGYASAEIDSLIESGAAVVQ